MPRLSDRDFAALCACATGRPLPPGELDWQILAQAAVFHRVLPALTRIAPLSSELEAADRAIRARAATQLADIMAIHREMADFDHLFFKGVALALTTYGDCAARASGDIDLLVRPEQLDSAIQRLGRLGYHQKRELSSAAWTAHKSSGNEIQLYRPDRSYALDLHWRVAPVYLPAPRTEDLLARACVQAVGNGSIPVMGAEDRLLTLAIHGCVSGWEQIRWVVDIDRCRSHQSIDWNLLHERAQSLGCGAMLGEALALTARLVHGGQSSSAIVEAWKECRRPDSWMRLRLVLESLQSWSARWRYARDLLLTPTERDYSRVRFPASMSILYRGVRLLTLFQSLLKSDA